MRGVVVGLYTSTRINYRYMYSAHLSCGYNCGYEQARSQPILEGGGSKCAEVSTSGALAPRHTAVGRAGESPGKVREWVAPSR